MKLKICGMTYEENITEVATLLPDFLGFIFYEKTPRYFNTNIPKLPQQTKKVGVFVNATLEDINKKSIQYGLDHIQLHGNESPDFCQKLQALRHSVIKVFSVDDHFDFAVLDPYEPFCDFFLFDTKGKSPGGNGYQFNWKILKKYPSTKPYFLSGGIGLNSIENLKEFLQTKESQFCYCIDVNSKFEIEPGLKDVKILKEFKSEL